MNPCIYYHNLIVTYHSFDVLIGTIFIYTQFIRISNYHLTSGHHVGLELSILY